MSDVKEQAKTTKSKVQPAPPKVEEPRKLTATQRLSALETSINSQYATIGAMADEIDRLHGVIQALAKRLNATIEAGETDGISGDAVNKIVLSKNTQELAGRVEFLVNQGVLVRNDNDTANSTSFVVGRDVDANKNVINPRVQFAVNSVEESLQKQTIGHKVGELIENQDGTFFEIIELYVIGDPRQNKTFEDENPSESDIKSATE